MGAIHGVDGNGKLRPKRAGGGVRNNPREDWFVVEDVHEPLVSPELWTKAHEAYLGRQNKGGLAKTTNRSLLSGLIICKHCGWRYGSWRSAERNGKRRQYYVDRGYWNGGRKVCQGEYIPLAALDAWVLAKVREALFSDHEDTAAAIEAFVQKVKASSGKGPDTGQLERELEAIDKRIKAMARMLADPTFEGLEELGQALAELKAKRDGLRRQIEAGARASKPFQPEELRAWAADRLAQAEQACNGELTMHDTRKVVHAFVDRIEIDPERKRGTLFLPPSAYDCFLRETSTQGALGDHVTTVKLPNTIPSGRRVPRLRFD
jgi:hypothetical protein